jgi:hypothetical protein
LTHVPEAVSRFLDELEHEAKTAGLHHPRTSAARHPRSPDAWMVHAWIDIAGGHTGVRILITETMLDNPTEHHRLVHEETIPGLAYRAAEHN